MDMTGWLEYFTHALSEQMQEIKTRGEIVIRADVLGKRYELSKRQIKAIQYILQHGNLAIKDFAQLCADTPRRSLQRDLKALVDKGILVTEGATNQLVYVLKL
jgi:predicted HTH transcriptional regulator